MVAHRTQPRLTMIPLPYANAHIGYCRILEAKHSPTKLEHARMLALGPYMTPVLNSTQWLGRTYDIGTCDLIHSAHLPRGCQKLQGRKLAT